MVTLRVKQVLSRLQKVINEWPLDSTKGRDLGEFLKNDYSKQFEIIMKKDMSKASVAIESLEKINSNYYYHRYPREKLFGFSGDVSAVNPWLLMHEEQANNKQESPSFWGKLKTRLMF